MKFDKNLADTSDNDKILASKWIKLTHFKIVIIIYILKNNEGFCLFISKFVIVSVSQDIYNLIIYIYNNTYNMYIHINNQITVFRMLSQDKEIVVHSENKKSNNLLYSENDWVKPLIWKSIMTYTQR